MYARVRRIYRFVSTHPLTKHQKIRTFGRFVWWQVRSRLSSEVIVPWVGGSRFIAKRSMRGFTGNIYAGLADYDEMTLLLDKLTPGSLFADVGANVGSYTILAAKACGARVVAFEPSPEARSYITRNVALNGVDDLVSVRAEAASAESGAGFFTTEHDTGNHLDTAGQAVAITTLDDALPETPFAIKIDTEGNDRAVLEGARRILADPALSIVIVEDKLTADLLMAAGFTRYGNPSSNAIFVRWL